MVPFTFRAFGNDPHSLAVEILKSLIIVFRGDGDIIRCHIETVTPEAANVMESGGNFLLLDFAYVFLGEIGSRLHFPCEEIFGVIVDLVAINVIFLTGDFKPCLREQTSIQGRRVYIAIEMDMGCSSILKFEDPKVVNIVSESAFQAFYESLIHFF